MAQNSLAEIYRLRGFLQRSLDLHEESYRDALEQLGISNELTIGLLKNLAGALRAAGQLQQSAQLGREALKLLTNVLGRDHRRTPLPMHLTRCRPTRRYCRG